MIRQYNSQRHRRVKIAGRIREIGTVPVGIIVLIQGRKLQVEAWIPREYTAFEAGRFITKRIAGGHLAQVRDLATGKTGYLSDAWLVDAVSIRTDEPDGRALQRRAKDRAAAAIDAAVAVMMEEMQ